jgi:hypothetical protein
MGVFVVVEGEAMLNLLYMIKTKAYGLNET